MEKCFTCVKNVICLLTLMIFGIFLVSCGTGQGTATSTTSTITTTTTTITTTTTTSTTTTSTTTSWTEQTLTWAGTPEPVTSTSTIITPEGTYRQYFTGPGGIWTATSNDGINWAAPVTSLATLGATNPAVIRLKDGSFLMIYGIQTPAPNFSERLYRATSGDGITFTKQAGPYIGGAVLTGEADDFVSVPDLIYSNDTILRMYFVSGKTSSRIHTATSTNNGQTWTKEGEITLTGSYGGQTNDPDIVQLAGGSYRLFFTTPPSGTSFSLLRLRSATSTDGRSFTVESGDILDPSGSVTSILDPDAVPVAGTAKYLLYYGTEPAGTLHAIMSP